jgi:O-acetyl-ADP-ribose deacetylase (regulator of RNase III)
MIKEIDCDIFDAPIDVLCHQANCYHTMGSGIARAIREKFPEAYAADLVTEKGSRAKLGTCSVAKITNPETRIKYVFNQYSQHTFGIEKRQTLYEAFYRCLEFTNGTVTNPKFTIGYPWKIGCKLGGGSWRVIREMIFDVFEDSTRVVYICKKPGDE